MARLNFVFCLFLATTQANDGRLQWKTLVSKEAYKSLPECPQKCLLNAWTATELCQPFGSFGCVCSENTLGPNYITSWKYVTDCAAKDCPDDKTAVTLVSNAFRDICAEAIDLYNNTVPLLSPSTGTATANSSSTTSPGGTAGVASSTTSAAARPTFTGRLVLGRVCFLPC